MVVVVLALLIAIIAVGLAVCYFIRHPLKSLKTILLSVIVLAVGTAVLYGVLVGLLMLGAQ